MKKTVLYILGITFTAITLTSCGTTKKGCGLTSDAQQIEQTTSTANSVIIAES